MVLVGVSGSAAGAATQTATHTFPQVSCTANVSGGTVTQKEDITVTLTAPDKVTPGQQFTVGFPGGSSVLPASASGFTVKSYQDLSLSYAVNGTTFDNGTIVNPGTATINGNPTANVVSLPTSTSIKIAQPGPFPPGTLVTPDVAVDATSGAVGSSVSLNALSLTTTANLSNGLTAKVTCNIPQDTIISVPVVQSMPAPTVDAGPDVNGIVNTAIALHGTVTSNGSPTDAWTTSDPACVVADPSAAVTTVSCSNPGTFTASLTADDGINAPVSDSAQISVEQNVPLVVNAGADVSGAVSHAITLNGTVSDPGHTPTSTWTINTTSCTIANAHAASTTVTCSAVGAFTATLSATDGANSAGDDAKVTVNADRPPVVEAGPAATGETGAPIALAGSVTDPENDPVAVAWAAPSACTFADAHQAATTITCNGPGAYTATLTGNDGFNSAVSDTTSVVVTDNLFPFNWDVDATTHLKKLNQDVTVPTGSFDGVVDLTTGTISGDITLPPAQMTLNLAGIGLVTANMQIVEAQPITGTLDPSTFAVSATAVFNINIPSAYPTATPTVNIVGDTCTTSSPVSVTMTGTANLAGASTFSGTYTIPNLKTCGVTTTALNLVVPGPGNTFTAVVQPPPAAPAVTTDPTDQTITPGQSYSFTAASSGYPAPAQQWQISTDAGSTFTNIAGATADSYTGTGALADSGHELRAVFTNASGTTTSAAATLVVAVAPHSPTVGNATARVGGANVRFTAPADDGGSPILDSTAQCTSSGGGVSGSGTNTSSPIAVTGLTAGAPYTCTVTARNVIGSSAPSSASNSVVPTAVPSVTTQPGDTSVPAGTAYSFTAAAAGVPAPTVQWQSSTDGGATFHDISGATDPSYSATAALADSGTQFRAAFTNSVGNATTNAATLTVTPVAPHITTQPDDQSVIPSGTYSFTAAAAGAPTPTVQWQVSTDGGTTFHDISGATDTTYTETGVRSDSGTRYRAVFTNSAGSKATNAATLTVADHTWISIGNAAIAEGDTGKARTAQLAVTLTQPSTQPVTVHYATANGRATAPTDYKAKSGTITFKAGKTTAYVSVAITPDQVTEANETVEVALSSPTGGYTLAPDRSTGVVTILNDDAGSGLSVRVGDASVCVTDVTAPVVKVWVSLSAPAPSTVTVVVTLVDGTAANGIDFKTMKPKTLTFKAGQLQKSVAVTAYPVSGGNTVRTASIKLSNASSGLTIGRATGTLTFMSE
ncbi:MAG TPA: Calx-beta domain-containing protein [Acidimicrobiia bacterium]|nr:Calx-beta domain-containing protein [Acidimicrobiia bacterium]